MSDSRLLQRLTDLRRMVRRRLAFFGLCAVAAGGIFAALGLVLLDWLLWLPPLLRLALGMAYLAGGLAAILQRVVLPLRERLGLGQLAGQLEQYVWRLDDGTLRRLEDRLSSTVDFLLGSPAGSARMRQRVIANTDRIVARIRFQDALSLRPLAVRGAVLLAAVALLVVTLAVSPSFAAAGLRRYAAPYSGVQWPRDVEIVSLSADARVAAGESVALRIRIARGQRPTLRPLMHLVTADGEVSTLAMQREGQDHYASLVSAIHDDLTCWFEAGDDNTRDRPLHIEVVQRPELVQALATIEPPAYVQRAEPVVVDLGVGEVAATPGSTVSVTVRSTKPLPARAANFSSRGRTQAANVSSPGAAAALEFTDGTEIALRRADDEHTAVAAFEFEKAVEFRVRLVDADGFTNRPDHAFRIAAQPDRPPNVAVLEPRAVTEVTPDGSVALLIRADDDFGLTSLEVVGRQIGSELPLRIALTGVMSVASAGDRVLGLADHVWSIASLGLQPGTALVYHAEAADNYAYRGAQPQVGRSAELRLKIISRAEFESRLGDEFALLQDRIRRAITDQESLKDQTDGLADRGSQSAGAPDRHSRPDFESAAGLATRQVRLANRVADLSRRFQRVGRRVGLNSSGGQAGRPELGEQLGRIARLLARTASEPMSAASRGLSAAGSPAASDRGSLLEQAGADQQTALDALAGIIRLMDQWGDFQEVVAKARDLLDRQQELRARTVEQGKRTLGRSPESLTEPEQAELRRAQRRQLRLAEEAERLLQRVRRLAEHRRPKDPAGADALEYALRAALAGEVVKLMRDAAAAIEANRTAAAVIGQRNSETALSRMLAALEERRQRQLAELAKRLKSAEQALAEILRQQRELFEVTGEARRQGAEGDVFKEQAALQRTIKRNTLRLAEDMADTPRVAAPAKLVGQAVEPMGRAESALDQADGAAAEDGQAEAIDLLVQAAAELEEIARQADFEAMQRSLAVVRAKLEEIRNRQQEINEQSVRLIELLTRNKRLGRAQNRRAARLARAQQELRPAVEEEVLPRLGAAAVYQWVLEGVLENVDRSARALGERRLDDALADDQRRIVAELDLLISALREAVQLPGPDRYAEGSGGGGGKGGQGGTGDQSPVPSVAELLVLKTMQLDLNARTGRIGDGFEPDTASEEQLRRLRQLGQRQQQIRALTERVTRRVRHSGP